MKIEDCIVYETSRHWVERTAKGHVVWRLGGTHSTLAATIGYTGAQGLQRAIAEVSRRESQLACL